MGFWDYLYQLTVKKSHVPLLDILHKWKVLNASCYDYIIKCSDDFTKSNYFELLFEVEASYHSCR